jgi:hypothetical protein
MNRWRLALAALLNEPPPPAPPPAWPTAWATEERRDARTAAAMSLLDDDVCGFFLLTFHRDDSHIAVSHVVDASWWAPIADVVAQVRADAT